MEQYLDKLETWIQSEQKVITYRFLSRYMGIHVEDSKQILFDYHKKCQESGKKCHAIYMISGYMNESIVNSGLDRSEKVESLPSNSQDESRICLESSTAKMKVFFLVKEEDIEYIKKKFDEITSIHVYSLELDLCKDSSTLSDAFFDSYNCIKYDEILSPEEMSKKYGIIHHMNVKVFPAGFQASNIDISSSKTTGILSEINSSQTINASSDSKEKTQTSMIRSFFDCSGHGTKSTLKSNKNPPKPIKRKSSFMDSFLNLGSNTESKPSSICSSNSVLPVKSLSNLENKESEELIVRRQQEINLLMAMMENQEKDDTNKSKESVSKAYNVDPIVKNEQVNLDKKRRGRRKVLKKVTSCDKKGYLVTKNEFVWESFSEDETAIPIKTKSDTEFKEGPEKNNPKTGETKITLFFSKK
ncbi:hypothetical protein PNEG_03503 [Pneumocystis murina B123]|uniref:DNA polymerase delta subunit 3 n=1 Tax=Pneumocystis murina (strain B123) TaxID=1069680 RepID=M7NHL8_PNEMU|nr:hypothetical protein PNEG_03503 [Pneumocystis murina B123]EMR08063.1 hypothetical protein PNEG_03503 [Pneumocystis murina B123]